MRPDSPRDFGAIQIIYLLTYLLTYLLNVGIRLMNARASMIKFVRRCSVVRTSPNSWGSSTVVSRRSSAVLTRYGNLFTIYLLFLCDVYCFYFTMCRPTLLFYMPKVYKRKTSRESWSHGSILKAAKAVQDVLK